MAEAALKNKYTEGRRSNEYILHIFERNLNASKSNKTIKNVKYDYTYVQTSDSVSILTTITVPNSCGTPSDIALSFCGKQLSMKPELIYVSPIKNGLEYRLRIAIPYEDWEEMINCAKPYDVIYKFSDNTSYHSFEFSYPQSKWNKVREELLQIRDIIRINTGKQ